MKRWIGLPLALALLMAMLLPLAGSAEGTEAEQKVVVAEYEENGTAAAAAKVISVSKKKTLNVYVGKSYQLSIPGKKIKTCKSSNSNVVKATKAGLLTVKKKGTAKVTVTPKTGKAFVLTLKASKKAVELSGYCGKNAKKSAAKLGLTSKKSGKTGSLKYVKYYKGGVSLTNIKGPWDKGQADVVRVEKTSDYSLIGVTVGMKVPEVRKLLKKYEDVNYFNDYGNQLYYVITWEGDQDFPITDLAVGYKSGKVTWISYGNYID